MLMRTALGVCVEIYSIKRLLFADRRLQGIISVGEFGERERHHLVPFAQRSLRPAGDLRRAAVGIRIKGPGPKIFDNKSC